MSTGTYNFVATLLLYGACGVLLLSLGYLVSSIIGWRGPKRNRRLIRFAVLLVAAPGLVGLQQFFLWKVHLPSIGRERKLEAQRQADMVSMAKVGDAAPTFAIKDIDGRHFDLREHRGKVVLINFFATWCGPCLQELPHVQKLADQHQDSRHFAILVIGREESDESVIAFRSKHRYSFPMAADPDRSVYGLYATELIPRTYIVSRDGKICYATTGFQENDVQELFVEVDKQLASH